ncbi:hypothetical protein L7F22_013718 [Adiantum nelumboides]|nr:hypothetical protein [Adiantum nelumboides]
MQSHGIDEKHDPIAGMPRLLAPRTWLRRTATAHRCPVARMLSSRTRRFILPSLSYSGSSSAEQSLYVLDDKTGLNFQYPVFLTTFHMAFSTVGTRLLARYTHLMDGLANVEMTPERWYKNILPIGALFSASLVTSNMAYLTLSVSFIQMLKAFMPVAVLLISFVMGLKQPSGTLLAIVFSISLGVATASYGEVDFVMSGFLYQVMAIAFESSRLVMIQVLLQGLKMDPLVSLHYFAPVCAAINFVLLIFWEGFEPFLDLHRIGPFVLLTNAAAAFCLNITAVFLIGAASSLVLTLCGVIKDILLIMGSVVLFNSVVTWLQIGGYSVALFGLVLFKLKG